MKTYQTGMSPISVLFSICLFAFLVVVGLKLMPHYIDYFTLKKLYSDVNAHEPLEEMSAQQIFAALDKRLMLNTVKDFNIKEGTVLSKETGVLKVGLDYEVVEHIFGNVSVILTFDYMPE